MKMCSSYKTKLLTQHRIVSTSKPDRPVEAECAEYRTSKTDSVRAIKACGYPLQQQLEQTVGNQPSG